MKSILSRRSFLAQATAAAAAVAINPVDAFAKTKTRKIQIGYTGITWSNSEIEQAIQTISKLGFYSVETFGDVLEKWEDKGGLGRVLTENKIPLMSGYCTMNLTDPSKRKDELDKAVKWSKLIKKYGGHIFVLGPNQVKRDSYVFNDHKSDIISALNEVAKTVTDQGLTPVLHQHTGTCIESRDETYATLDAVDTRVLKFGPDVGQLTKGGQDALKVVKDYISIVHHMHLKDWNGEEQEHLLGYCPLGQGKVDVPGILDAVQGRKMLGRVMVELDVIKRTPPPKPSEELAKESRDYLAKLGVKFRA